MVYILKTEPSEFFEWCPIFLREMRFADRMLSLRRKRLAKKIA